MKTNTTARREAAVKRWEPVTPDEDLLREARGGRQYKAAGLHYEPVRGPHLRRVCRCQAKNRLGVPGISLTHRRGQRVLSVCCGQARHHVNVDALGPNEAWRRALKVRAEHERKVALANAAILAARARTVAGLGEAGPGSTTPATTNQPSNKEI